jgi:hypothetical protein
METVPFSSLFSGTVPLSSPHHSLKVMLIGQ